MIKVMESKVEILNYTAFLIELISVVLYIGTFCLQICFA